MNAPIPAGPATQDFAAPDFEALYRNNYAFVWRCGRRMCVGEDELEDVIQDVFVIAYRRRARLDPEAEPRTWLFGILRNVVRNRGRGRNRHRRRVDAFAQHVELLEQQRRRLETERLLGHELLAEFLRKLDEDQRAVFVLAELEGYTGREIGEALGINPNTAQSRLRLARRAFCAHFELEPSRRVVASTTRELRERPSQPSDDARAHSWGLVVAAIAHPAWSLAPVAGLSALLSGKAALLLAGVGVVSVAVLGLAVAQPVGPGDSPEASLASSSAIVVSSPSTPTDTAPAVPLDTSDDVAELPLTVQLQRPSLAAKVKLPSPAESLRHARAALIDDHPDQALALLDAIPQSESRLLGQRAATRVAALCKLGEIERARTTVAELRGREPDSPLLDRIEGGCW